MHISWQVCESFLKDVMEPYYYNKMKASRNKNCSPLYFSVRLVLWCG